MYKPSLVHIFEVKGLAYFAFLYSSVLRALKFVTLSKYKQANSV